MIGLLELAERCEQATGPDRELDHYIGNALGWRDEHTILEPIPTYTASLDAAMTLVPEGWAIIVGAYPDARKPFARLFPPDYANSPLEHQESDDCASHALALCAAALRARAAAAPHHPGSTIMTEEIK